MNWSVVTWNVNPRCENTYCPLASFTSTTSGLSAISNNSRIHSVWPLITEKENNGHFLNRPERSLQNKIYLDFKLVVSIVAWRREEKGTTEDKMVGWHHGLNEYEFEQTPRDSEGQGSLTCCSSWGRKESDTTEQLNNHKGMSADVSFGSFLAKGIRGIK